MLLSSIAAEDDADEDDCSGPEAIPDSLYLALPACRSTSDCLTRTSKMCDRSASNSCLVVKSGSDDFIYGITKSRVSANCAHALLHDAPTTDFAA